MFLPQTGSSHVPLALPRRIPLKCNVGLQVAQSHKKETYVLKDNSKRLPLLNHNWKRLLLTITNNWIRFWILDIQSEVFTKQYEQNRLCFSRHLRILRYELLSSEALSSALDTSNNKTFSVPTSWTLAIIFNVFCTFYKECFVYRLCLCDPMIIVSLWFPISREGSHCWVLTPRCP